MIPYKYWRIKLDTVTPKPSDRDVEVAETSKVFKRSDGKVTQEVTNYVIEFLAIKGTTQKVKLPLELADKIAELQSHLDKNEIVRVKFIDLQMKVFSMQTEKGNLVGITACASDFEITKIESVEDDFDNIIL